jgi:carboxyl-terminal processing protease
MSKRLDDFSTYNIVAGYYYVNDLPNYDGVGITPDIIVDMDSELIGTDEDIQLKKAIELLS